MDASRKTVLGVLTLGALLAAGGCYQGSPQFEGSESQDGGGDGDGDGDGDTCSGELVVAPRPIHRLSRREYQNTITDLFGLPGFVATYAETEEIITLQGVRQLRSDAETIVESRATWGELVFPCDIDGATDDACAQDLVTEFGAKLYRRPLSAEEIDGLMTVYAETEAAIGFADAMEVVVATMLQAPAFVYQIEVGEPVPDGPDHIRKLTGYEVASRLSYSLWGTTPDDELLNAAAAGELDEPAGIEAQAARLLASERAEDSVQAFFSELLELDGGQLHFGLEELSKDPELFPDFDGALADAMRTEVEALVRDQFLESGSFEGLMTTNRAYLNASLAEIYGVSGPADDDTWEWVDLDPSQRAGLFNRAAFLTVYASGRAQSPIRRGTYVLERALCVGLGDPPPDVDDSPVDGGQVDGQTLTVREEVALRTQGDTCQACHSIINPAGFALEAYDAIGRWQDTEVISGLEVDSSGSLLITDAQGDVDGPVALAQALSASRDARACFAEHWVEHSMGLDPETLGPCDQQAIIEAFEDSGDTQALIRAVTVSDSFRYLNTEGE